MFNLRMLGLNPENKYFRVLRRAVVVGLLTAVAVLLKSEVLVGLIPPIYQILTVPVLTAVLAGIDKFIGEMSQNN